MKAIESAGYVPGEDVALGLDVAFDRILQKRPLSP